MRLLVLLLLAPLVACGFAPVYAPVSGHGAAADLGQVFVAVIPDRTGQLLRQALQVRLEGPGAPAAKRYTLAIAYGISSEGIAIQPDNSTTFIRYKGTATWRLLGADPAQPALATGTANAQDGYSVIVNQYFYTDLHTSEIYQRMADNIADQIVVRLANWFRARNKVAAQ